MLIKVFLFIASIFLLSDVQAMSLEDSLKTLGERLAQLKGKLGVLKSTLGILKANLSVVPQLEAEIIRINSLTNSAPSQQGMTWELDRRGILTSIKKVINALKGAGTFDEDDLGKILNNAVKDSNRVLEPADLVVTIFKTLQIALSSKASTVKTLASNVVREVLDIIPSMRNTLKQLIPTRTEFQKDESIFLNSLCTEIEKYSADEIKSTTERFKVSSDNYLIGSDPTRSGRKKNQGKGLSISFEKGVDNVASLFNELYFDRIFEDLACYERFIDPTGTYLGSIANEAQRDAAIEFIKECKKFYDKEIDEFSPSLREKLDEKHKALDDKKKVIEKRMNELVQELNSYSDSDILDQARISSLLGGKTLYNLNKMGGADGKLYHQKAQDLIKNSVNLKYFKDNYVDSKTGKTNDALKAFERELNEHLCTDVLSYLNTIKEEYKNEVSAEQAKKTAVIDDILSDGLHDREDLEKKTLVKLNQLLGKLKLRRAPPPSNPLGGPPPPPPLPFS